MTEVVGGLGIVLGALGAALIVCSDAGRGAALGLAIIGVGLGAAASSLNSSVAAVSAGAGVAAALLHWIRADGWGVLPAGSTPRVIFCVLAAGAGLWVALSVLTVPGGRSLRGTAVLILVMTGWRVISASPRQVALAGVSALAVTAGVIGFAAPVGGFAAVAAGAATAIAAALLPHPRRGAS